MGPGSVRHAFVLLALLCGNAVFADDAARWRVWLDSPAALSSPAPVFPSAAELASLRRDRGWIERWASQSPSVAWNDLVGELVVKYQQSPLRAARNYAYTHIAIHDALVRCARAGCDAAGRKIAMHAAASRMLDHLYPDESRGRLEALGYSAAAATGGSDTEAWRVGRAVADTAIRRALYDGWDLPRLPAKRPAWKAGVWRMAPPINIYDPIEPHAGEWRTWVMKAGADIRPPPPPEYGSTAYWEEVDEVLAVSKALTPAQKKIADDWNLGAGSVTPPGVWNMRAKELVVHDKLDAEAAARVFATLNAAMADAMIACWHAKYEWWTERPVTVIRAERDAQFMPYLVTPGFPSYVSGHSTVSGAAAEVLAAFFPAESKSLEALAEEAAVSRLYGGIHFRSDNEQGLILGRTIGRRALARLDEPLQSGASTR